MNIHDFNFGVSPYKNKNDAKLSLHVSLVKPCLQYLLDFPVFFFLQSLLDQYLSCINSCCTPAVFIQYACWPIDPLGCLCSAEGFPSWHRNLRFLWDLHNKLYF